MPRISAPLFFFFFSSFLAALAAVAFCAERAFPGGCRLEGLHPLLVVTYRNVTVSVDKITVPHGERVAVRCREIGRYKLVGDSALRCRDAAWNGRLPSCAPTTAVANFTDDVPPTIVFGLPAGSAAVEPSGALAVFPGSILHLECLFARRLGDPEWTWTSAFRRYLTDVRCPVLNPPEPPLIGRIEGARMGQGAVYECPAGYRLEGAAGLTCRYDGKWSSSVPRCETIECPPMDTLEDARLQLLEYDNTFGGRAVFACMWGHRLLGSRTVECEADGSWTGDVPSCAEITCPAPTIPKSGRIVERTYRRASTGRKERRRSRVYKVGALVGFACSPGHQLLGEASAICTENGTWSHSPPVCKVRCPYPGDPPHGRIAPLKFWYKPGDNVQVTCSPGYVTPLEPVRKPTCRENGVWSAPPPPCRSYKDV